MTKASSFQIKDVALLFMDTMNFPPVAKSLFRKIGVVCLFGGGIFYDGVAEIPVGSDLHRRIQKLEQESNVKVFAVSRDYFEPIGECYSFLCISQYEEDWKYQFADVGDNTYRCYAYVWNVGAEHLSEFGSVYIESHNGVFRRVG